MALVPTIALAVGLKSNANWGSSLFGWSFDMLWVLPLAGPLVGVVALATRPSGGRVWPSIVAIVVAPIVGWGGFFAAFLAFMTVWL